MRANKQSDYALRYTGNYFDQIEGYGYHSQPLTFHEFLSKPESLFMYDGTFFQIPEYIQVDSEIRPIEEVARQYITNFIMDEFSHMLLGMQDYVRWGMLFEHKCASIAPSFWAQVNMINLMQARELEMDTNSITRTNTGNAIRLGGQTVVTEQQGTNKTTANAESTQDIDNTQGSDTVSRQAVANIIRADNQLTDDVEYDWTQAADNVQETRGKQGDTHQHTHNISESNTESESNQKSSATTSMNNSSDRNENVANETSELTNKQFVQERQGAINTARDLLPLEWLRVQLRPMFYMIY